MDLLQMLHSGEISLEEAERLFDDNLERFNRGEEVPPWNEAFELSIYEASAKLHGASLAYLAKLRYEGWPASCYLCGEPLDYRLGGWWFVPGEGG